MTKEDIHIQILRYGVSKTAGFTVNELCTDLGLTEIEQSFIRTEIRGADIVAGTSKYRIQNNTDFDNQILIISFEARFKFLQYVALEEARKSSRNAIYIAIGSLLIAAVVGIMQILISLGCF